MTLKQTIYVQVPVVVEISDDAMTAHAEKTALAAVDSRSGRYVSMRGRNYCEARADFSKAKVVKVSD